MNVDNAFAELRKKTLEDQILVVEQTANHELDKCLLRIARLEKLLQSISDCEDSAEILENLKDTKEGLKDGTRGLIQLMFE
ncbi:hypothetical protein K9N08_02350 [Candidatus Gracilibacteria bacterium]|nr:hypothetical protein [Candidatus Gracilibacteria bacterium]MCF7856377.1 hypothetical protein [Candidatus Gracilibacteria bacterium]MCF7896827.1 hypothetical protein [Candidatus Gracilibacteria bacterium]